MLKKTGLLDVAGNRLVNIGGRRVSNVSRSSVT